MKVLVKALTPLLYLLAAVILIFLTLWASSRVYSFTFLLYSLIAGGLLFSATNIIVSRFEHLNAPKLLDHVRHSFLCYALLLYFIFLFVSDFSNFLHNIHDTECIRTSSDSDLICAWDLKFVYFFSLGILTTLEAILVNTYYLLWKRHRA